MPRVVLFTGGSASNLLARALEAAGIAVTHVVSVFDNGGSTGRLRRIADLPAMGDIRNRLCALAGSSTPGAIRMRSLFQLRLSKGGGSKGGGSKGRGSKGGEIGPRQELDALAAGDHYLTKDLHPPDRREVLDALAHGRAALPADFHLATASLGNLLIFGRDRQTGSFLEAIDWAARLLGVRSRVLPVTLGSVHLGAELDDGQWLVGQAALTSGGPDRQRRIARLSLLREEDSPSSPVGVVEACPQALEAIASADVIVFGFGSFYSSVLPHLLVPGIADAIARRPVPRVFLTNPTADRETAFMTVADVLRTVTAHAGAKRRDRSPFLTHVVHFSGRRDLAIPAGNLSGFLESGGEVLSEPDSLSFEAIARRATNRTLSLLPAGSIAARESPESGYPVVLVDLDHTLLEYGTLRRGAAIAALSTFCQSPADTCDLLLEHLVVPATHVLREYGFPDLRREWNCPAFYAWARLVDEPTLREQAVRALREVGAAASLAPASSPFEARRRFHAIAREPEHSAGWRSVAAEALRLATEGDERFAAQLAAFETHVGAHADLVPGARSLLEDLAGDDVRVVVVTEGNSPVQRTKMEYLGLDDLVTSAVVTDRTLGVASLVEEIFLHSTKEGSTPAHLGPAYDELCQYLVKTPAFYGKLIHSLVADGPRHLETAIEGPVFLTLEEWQSKTRPRVATVGDRYNKDLEPLLAVCSHGVAAFRVLQGRYSADFPLHEILANDMPAPVGHFASLAAVRSTLIEWAGMDGPVVSRPPLTLHLPTLETFADSADYLSPAAARTLAKINTELGRHPR